MQNKTFKEKEIERIKYLIKKIEKNDFTSLPVAYQTYNKEYLLKKLKEDLNYFTIPIPETKLDHPEKGVGNHLVII